MLINVIANLRNLSSLQNGCINWLKDMLWNVIRQTENNNNNKKNE